MPRDSLVQREDIDLPGWALREMVRVDVEEPRPLRALQQQQGAHQQQCSRCGDKAVWVRHHPERQQWLQVLGSRRDGNDIRRPKLCCCCCHQNRGHA